MSKQYRAYTGRFIDANKLKLQMHHFGYDSLCEAGKHRDSIVSVSMNCLKKDSFCFEFTFLNKGYDFNFFIKERVMRIYKNNKLFRKIYTDKEGTIRFSLVYDDFSTYELSIGLGHPSINLRDYMNKKVIVYYALSHLENFNCLDESINVKLKSNRRKKICIISGVRLKVKYRVGQVTQDEVDSIILSNNLPKISY